VLGSDGKITVHEARLIGLDPTCDLAVLKVWKSTKASVIQKNLFCSSEPVRFLL